MLALHSSDGLCLWHYVYMSLGDASVIIPANTINSINVGLNFNIVKGS